MERKEIEEKLKNLLRLYTNSIKDYELENRGSIGQDERESMEFVEIFIDSEDEFGYNDILESLSGNSDKEAKPLFELKQDESGHVEMHIIEEDKLDFKAVPYIISEVKEELPTNEWISVNDMAFLKWYSGMEEAKILNAHKRYKKEVLKIEPETVETKDAQFKWDYSDGTTSTDICNNCNNLCCKN